MLPSAFIKKMDDDRPKVNRKIAEGLAISESKNIPSVIDHIMKEAFSPVSHLVTYHGYSDVDVKEQFQEFSRGKNNRRHFEVLESDFTFKRYAFKFQGEMFYKLLALPFVTRLGGALKTRGTMYNILPTMEDNLFSMDGKKIYIPLTRSKLVATREIKTFSLNGRAVSGDIHWSRLLYLKEGQQAKNYPTLLNYLFCYYGIAETFKRFDKTISIMSAKDYDEEKWPKSEYDVCTTSNLDLKRKRYNEDFVLVVPKDENDQVATSLIATFFYMIDNCCDEQFMTVAGLTDPMTWHRVLARHIWKDVDELDSIRKLNEHFESIGYYIDVLVKPKLARENIFVDNIFELAQYLIINFSKLSIDNEINSTVGKRFGTVPNILYPLITMIFKLTFTLAKFDPAVVKRHDIDRLFGPKFRPQELMFQLYGLPNVTVLDSATDLMLMKTTSEIYNPLRPPASDCSTQMYDPAYQFHETMLLAHANNMVTKAEPSGRGRINCFIKLGRNNEVIVPDNLVYIMKQISTYK